ncbi:sigma 54-interacting transcriptional regulator [Sporosarcina sp. G11-34]|uniref:sigma 54-interacting transcriptional regulator n=1 Tax=Sporosarcina sp. G11-34 TaxID=2849605 RepID=UPI0022A96C04|nr:sigma 54-interacting transcriptional regulator [Sporosarcina sp. G11-34]MCZ2260123.1 sigma 54-interacting transcriptional regulator [Sporosarcina sp. G11-34]
MQNILIVGAGTGGSIILDLLQNLEFMNVKAIIDVDENAPGIIHAKSLGIAYGTEWESYLTTDLHIIFDVTDDETVFAALLQAKPAQTVLVPGSVANLFARLLQENDVYIKRIRGEMHKQRMVFDSIEEGMIGINEAGRINFFNRSASKMIGVPIKEVVGKPISKVVPSTRLLSVLNSGKSELNKELVLGNGLKIVTSRYPLLDYKGRKVGAFAVFKDITEVVALAEEITDLEKVKTMLEAIIYSSNDAISVVDEEGNGIIVNPAYTRITGLSEEQIIGQPASADINEGESIHMKVLKTRKPVRGVHMRVGENNREVIVNVAPIIVDGHIKGSVGVIHDKTEMRNLMKELDQARTIIRKLESTYTFDDIIGRSSDIEISIEQAKLAAKSNLAVLLRGETGTGKELFAHAIHSGGERKLKKFIRVNCAAIHPITLEEELFGVEKGDVENDVSVLEQGLFEEAENGTLFLDEISELPLAVQRKLLHYLQSGTIYRVGSERPLKLSVRVITATSKNLEKAMHDGFFNEELYYALNRISIQIVPLRLRKEDIPSIVEHLLVKLNQEFGMKVEVITTEAQKWLQQYDWPGNVRELENILSRAMIFTEPGETTLELKDIKKTLSSSESKDEDPFLPEKSTLGSIMDEYEKTILETALRENAGNKSLTANRLGISLRSLYYKLEKFSLDY